MPKLNLIASFYWLCLAQKVVSGDLYHKVGGEIVLKPDESTVPDPITSIVWKHGKNKVAEWDKGFGMEIYAAFKNRTTLDQTTGELTITGLKKTDSGVYSFEFNGKLLNKIYKLSVIKAVPKPTITSSCNPDKTSCTLTCEGDTTDAEPVTYSWKVGDGLWEVGGKQMVVSSSNTGDLNSGYMYICKLKNSAGEGEVSDPVGDVFDPEAVPKPTITSSCNPDKTCTLTCEGDTTDAEPVTYSWKVGEGLWEVIGKQLIVSKSDTGKSTNGYKYICKLKNSVSSEISEPVGDLFDSEPSEVGGVGVGVVVILVLVAIVVAGILWVWKIKKEHPNNNMREMFSMLFYGTYGVPLTGITVSGEEKAKNAGNGQGNGAKASDGNNQTTAKVSDGVQPDQGGNDKTKTDGSVGPGGKDETKTDGSVGPGGNDETKTGGSFGPGGNETKTVGSDGPGGNDETKADGSFGPGGNETKTDSSAGPGGNETKTDGSDGPGGNDETKTDGSVGPGGNDEIKTDVSFGTVGNDETKADVSVGPGGNDETKTDGSVGPGGNDETKTDGSVGPGGNETKTDVSVGPGGDINAAEKGEANGEESMLLNEDAVNHHNDNGDGAEEDNSVL